MTSDNFENPVWQPLGDQGLMLDFTGFTPVTTDTKTAEIDDDIARHIAAIASHIEAQNITGLIEIVPSLTRLLFIIDPNITSTPRLKQLIEPELEKAAETSAHQPRHWLLPICYEGECGPDIDDIARRTNLSPDEVIARHLAHELTVSVMGFMPGLGYMTGVDPALSLPRRANPRTHVPERSVGIAIGQCVIYPLTSPGGWHLIGRISYPLFDTKRDEPILLRRGDRVRFKQISIETLHHQEQAYHNGTFTAADLIEHKGQSYD